MKSPSSLLLLAGVCVLASITPRLGAQPANDKIETAQALDTKLTINRINGTVERATDEAYLVLEGGQLGTRFFPRTVWYRWTAPIGGQVVVAAAAGGFLIFGETFSGTGANDLVFVAEDNITEGSLNTYTFNATAGVTYFTAFKDTFLESTPGLGSKFVYVQTFLQDPLSDNFSTRTPVVGRSFTISGDLTSFSEEAGEPKHSTGNVTSTGKSAWITWSSPTRAAVTITTENSSFDALVAVYTGTSVDALTRVASGRSSSRGGINSAASRTTTVSFIASAGVPYQIAIDGSRDRAGAFKLTLEARTVAPGFVVQPASTTVTQGEVAVFDTTVEITGETATYQWERLLPGQKTWVPLEDDGATINGSRGPTLTVATTLEMDQQRFRVIVTDSVGPAASRPATLTVTEFPAVNTEIRGSVSFDLSEGILSDADGGYFAKGLPAGFTLNSATGVVTANSLVVRPGTYRISYWAVNDGVRSKTYTLLLIVDPFSAALSGSFEALLLGADNLPREKLEITINATGAFTGRIYSLAESRFYPVRGQVTLDQDLRLVRANDISVNRGALPALELDLMITESDSKLTADLVNPAVPANSSSTTNGARIATFNAAAPAPWAGVYTALLSGGQAVDSAPALPIPGGNGYASASVAPRTGNLVLRGQGPDGVPFSASLRPSADAEYRVAQKAYAGTGGYLAGAIRLVPRAGSTVAYHSTEFSGSLLYLNKPAVARDRSYPLGFGPVSYRVEMEPWTAVASNVPASLGLSANGSFTIGLESPEFSNAAPNSRELPVNLQISSVGRIAVLDPNANARLALGFNRGTGVISGSFLVQDPAVPPAVRPTVRKVTIGGVLMQKPLVVQDLPIGGGFLLLPPLNPATGSTVSGKVSLNAGEPALPF